MEVIGELGAVQSGSPSVVTVGVFDGVHVGHQAIMRMVTEDARLSGVRSVAITFNRNPQEYSDPSAQSRYITTLEQKLALIADEGIDLTIVLPLERHILDISAHDFISGILHRKLSAKRVVIGEDFRFGKGREGNANVLRAMGSQFGYEVDVVPPVTIGNTIVSSTAIRQLITDGDVVQASIMLGRPFVLYGSVVKGNEIGRTIGFPTANIQQALGQVTPARGVYSVLVMHAGKRWSGVTSIGTRPTVGGAGLTIEVHLIGFSGDLYGQDLEVSFHHRLRDEVRFSDLTALKAQIALDVSEALALDAGERT